MSWYSLIVDALLVGIVALCAWRGWKQGIVVGAVSIAAIIACVCAGNIVADTYDEEFMAVPQSIGNGLVDSVMTKVLEADYTDIVVGEDDDLVVRLTSEQKRDSYMVSYAVCRQLGFSDQVSASVSRNTAEITGTVNQAMSSILCGQISLKLTHFLVFCVAFLLTIIILSAIKNTIDIFLTLPGIEFVNRIIGAVLGGVKGVIFVLLITAAMRYTGLLIGEDITGKTLIAGWLIQDNMLATLIGI